MKKFFQSTLPLILSILALAIVVAAIDPLQANGRPALGVSNFDSIHLSDANGTATPNFLANQRGSGVIAEFRDGGTPVARIPNGGGLRVLSGAFVLGQQSETVTATFILTPTAPYIVMTSDAAYTSSTTTPIITTTATAGQLLLLLNGNASDVLTVDGTGGTVECKADVALGAGDTLTLIYESTDAVWYCISNYDNS